MIFLSCRTGHSQEEKITAAGPRIAVITDIHYLAPELHDGGNLYQRVITEGDGKNMTVIRELLETLIFCLEKDRPDILLLTGDLSFNGEKKSHQGLAAWLKKIEKLGIRVYVIPGNHDINNPGARRFEGTRAMQAATVSAKEFSRIYRAFGYGEAVSRDADTLSYLAEPFPGLRLLMLDSNLYEHNLQLRASVSQGQIGESTRRWIREQVDASRREGCEIVMTMHHSLVEHNPAVSMGFTVADSEELISFFSALEIGFVLTGHIHAQSISGAATEWGTIYDIATSAFSVYPHEYGMLELNPEEGAWHYYLKGVDVESWARAADREDPRLLDFSSYAKGFFTQTSERMIRRRMNLHEDEFSEAETQVMVDIFNILNCRFFEGNQELNQGDPRVAPFYRPPEGKEIFRQSYIDSIFHDSRPPANRELLFYFSRK